MAKAKHGLFGEIRGKIGNIIASSWKGIPYFRSKQKPYKSSTPAQLLQRKRFSITHQFINLVKPVINAGYQSDLQGMTELNSASSYIMKWALKGGLKDLAVNYPAVLVAKGDLPMATGGQAQPDGGGGIIFSWENAPDLPAARAADKALMLAYCPQTQQACWSVEEGIQREAGHYSMALPAGMAGRPVQTWLAFTTPDRKEASNSVWLGSVII